MKYRQAFLKRKSLSYLCGGAIIFLSTSAALAADAVEAVTQVVGCATVKDDKDRLSCFDKAAATLTTPGVPSGPKTANTKEIVTRYSPNDFKVVDPGDLHVAPGKFVGKPFEIRKRQMPLRQGWLPLHYSSAARDDRCCVRNVRRPSG
ncbi:hypothetical protein [Bradyrhizobium arachidis]|uniref:hypothetical protein n=1 Tax=Bradyrhizobium arachidis TaxID=858423 RepID=UPI00216345A1|nr:hypothetical protein [Bradyrhizobium arachidis]UVO30242.1 hypothetical protein KUF59_05655 [Bradyrhizobium arachidis]